VKNKESGAHEYLDVVYDNTIGTIQSAVRLSRQSFKAREKIRETKAREQAKLEMEAQESGGVYRRKERAALRCLNGKRNYANAEGIPQ
jgi:hypothetical protein